MARWRIVDADWLDEWIQEIVDIVKSKLGGEYENTRRAKWQEFLDEIGFGEMPEEWEEHPPFFISQLDMKGWAEGYPKEHPEFYEEE